MSVMPVALVLCQARGGTHSFADIDMPRHNQDARARENVTSSHVI
jgi:hypothetical protein